MTITIEQRPALDFYKNLRAEMARQIGRNTTKLAGATGPGLISTIFYKTNNNAFEIELPVGKIDHIALDQLRYADAQYTGCQSQHQRIIASLDGMFEGFPANYSRLGGAVSNGYFLTCGGERLPFLMPRIDFHLNDYSRGVHLSDIQCQNFLGIVASLEPKIFDGTAT